MWAYKKDKTIGTEMLSNYRPIKCLPCPSYARTKLSSMCEISGICSYVLKNHVNSDYKCDQFYGFDFHLHPLYISF